MNLTEAQDMGYLNRALAKSSAGISLSQIRVPRRSIEALFLRPQFMVDGMGALRSVVSRSDKANPVPSITIMVSLIGDRFKTKSEDNLMSKITPELMQAHNKLSAYILQLKALLVCIGSEDNTQTLSPEILLNALWAVSDRLEDVERLSGQVWDELLVIAEAD